VTLGLIVCDGTFVYGYWRLRRDERLLLPIRTVRNGNGVPQSPARGQVSARAADALDFADPSVEISELVGERRCSGRASRW
jgi:hypothetical protein